MKADAVDRSERKLSSVGRLMRARRGSILALAASSLAGGLAEAVLLVAITRTAFALTDGSEEVEAMAGHSLSVTTMIGLMFVLVMVRLALAIAATWLSARITNEVLAEIRRQLSRAFLRSSWSVQQDQRAGRLQELLTTFATNSAYVVGGIAGAVMAGLNLVALIGLAR